MALRVPDAEIVIYHLVVLFRFIILFLIVTVLMMLCSEQIKMMTILMIHDIYSFIYNNNNNRVSTEHTVVASEALAAGQISVQYKKLS